MAGQDSERAGWPARHHTWARNNGIYALAGFATGQPVEISTIGGSLAGEAPLADFNIVGSIQDNKQGIIKVEKTDGPRELAGRHVGLAVLMDLQTPADVVVRRPLKGCLAQLWPMAYYFPEDLSADAPYGCPAIEAYHFPAASYGGAKIGGLVLFSHNLQGVVTPPADWR